MTRKALSKKDYAQLNKGRVIRTIQPGGRTELRMMQGPPQAPPRGGARRKGGRR